MARPTHSPWYWARPTHSPWYWDRFDELDRYIDDLPDERDELPDRDDDGEPRIDTVWDEMWEDRAARGLE